MKLFNEQNATAMALFFILSTKQYEIEHLKLMKLLYLTEREHLDKFGLFISDDTLISMKFGPALHNVKEIIAGRQQTEIWNQFISKKCGDNSDKLLLEDDSVTFKDLNILSGDALQALSNVWNRFGDMDSDELVEYTHEKWKETSNEESIDLKIVLASLGKSVDEINFITHQLESIKPFSIFIDDNLRN